MQATESRPRVYGPGMGDEGSAPNFSKIWNFPGKQGNSSSGKKIIIIKNNNNTNDCHSQTSGYMAYVKSRCVVWTDDGNLSIMHRSILSRWGGGGQGGRGGGRVLGGDLTFFKNFAFEFLPTGKSFQSIATKFPHLGLHIAVKYPKAEPKKCTIKISPDKLKRHNLYLQPLLHHQRYML